MKKNWLAQIAGWISAAIAMVFASICAIVAAPFVLIAWIASRLRK